MFSLAMSIPLERRSVIVALTLANHAGGCASPSSCPDEECVADEGATVAAETTLVTTGDSFATDTGEECSESPVVSAGTLHSMTNEAVGWMTGVVPDAVLVAVFARPLEEDGTIVFPAWPGDDPQAGWRAGFVSPTQGMFDLHYFADDRCPALQFLGGDPAEAPPLDIGLVPDSPELVSEYAMDPACAPLSAGVTLAVLGPSPNIQVLIFAHADSAAPTWTMDVTPDGTQTVCGCG